MKLQPCNPVFIDARNAILNADTLLYGGAHAF
ncbi:MAG: M36 family metallopeptidase [Bacteroidetes bacterium]|nr:M36 family metallopeptidase [Bacteroidota bacterium]